MSRSVVADLKEMAKQMKRYAELSHPKVLRALADEAVSLVAIGFETSTAPDGTPWAPLKVRAGMPLRDTGRLMNSIATKGAARRTKRGFTIGTNVDYAGYHQGGTKRMVARPFLPGDRLSPEWERSLEEAADEALERLAKK